MENAYGSFAGVYEELMDNVPYDAWCSRILELFREAGLSEGLVAELGCGTGSMTRRLADAGYDMIGIDASPDMLDMAREQEMEIQAEAQDTVHKDLDQKDPARKDILYLLQDMRSFELYGTVGAVVCCCDSINYILKSEEVQEVFRLVNNYLDPEGLLVMDFHPPVYYSERLKDRTIAEVREDVAMFWENEEAGDDIHRFYLTIFQEDEDGRYERFDEEHVQRGYTPEALKKFAEAAGLRDIRFYDGYTGQPAGESSERILMTARECGKTAQTNGQ